MPHNYCYHSKKSKLIYFEFSSHCLVWLASRLASLHRAEPSLIFWLAKIASRAELGSFTCRAEPSRAELSSARLVSSPSNEPDRCVAVETNFQKGLTRNACACRCQCRRPARRQRSYGRPGRSPSGRRRSSGWAQRTSSTASPTATSRQVAQPNHPNQLDHPL